MPETDLELNACVQPAEQPSIHENGAGKNPDGGYGWVISGAALVSMAVSWGINATYSVYVSFLIQDHYFPGGSALRYGFVGGLAVSFALVIAPLNAILVNRFGFRASYFIGIIGVVLGQCLAGISKSYGEYLVCQGLLFGLGLGAIYLSVQTIVVEWFDRRLGLALGLTNAGSGLGGLIFSNTTRLLIEKYSMKWALVINGATSAVVLLPVMFMLKKGPIGAGRRSAALELSWLLHPGFAWVIAWGLVSTAVMAYFIVQYTIATYSSDGLGLSQTNAAALQSLFAAGLLVGRPFVGILMDKAGHTNICILMNALSAISCWAFWLPSRSFALVAVFSISQGIAGGTVWTGAAPVAAKMVGTARAGSALAIFFFVVTLPIAFSSPSASGLVSYSRTHLGRSGAEAYAISIAFCGALYFLSAIFLYMAKAHSQKSFRLFQKV